MSVTTKAGHQAERKRKLRIEEADRFPDSLGHFFDPVAYSHHATPQVVN
jgi:hypothetical protein